MYTNANLLSICECMNNNTNNQTKYLTSSKFDTLSLFKYIEPPNLIPSKFVIANQTYNNMETRRVYPIHPIPNEKRAMDINANQYPGVKQKKENRKFTFFFN